MKTVSLVCGVCGKAFEKPANEYRRRIKAGAVEFYCGLSCTSVHSNAVSPRKGNPQYLIADNRKDKFTAIRWFLRRARNRTKRKGPTDLTEEYLKELWELQKGICPFTGWTLRFPGPYGWVGDDRLTPDSASLDRIDCSKGYIQGNVRYVAVMANYARNKFNDEEVLKFARSIVEYHDK